MWGGRLGLGGVGRGLGGVGRGLGGGVCIVRVGRGGLCGGGLGGGVWAGLGGVCRPTGLDGVGWGVPHNRFGRGWVGRVGRGWAKSKSREGGGGLAIKWAASGQY